jgi:hypothetical protein
MALLLKTVDASRGPRWVGDAFSLFKRRSLPFALMFTAFLFAALLVSAVPVVGGLLQMMLMPLLSLGFMVASQSALLDGPVSPRQFIEPLQGDAQRRKSLLILCVGYGVCAALILLLCDAVSNSALERLQALMARGDSTQAEVQALLNEPGVGMAMLLGLGLGTALSVPYWHAPALVHWGGQSVGQALFSSALAVWRAKAALFTYMATWTALVVGIGLGTALVFGLLGLGQLATLVSVPAGLFLSTLFYVSLLFTFNDSFGGSTRLRSDSSSDSQAGG